jgi:uncharacterized protein
MKLKHIKLPIDQIQEFCDRWQITEFALFGSVLRDDFRPDSDLDVLVTFAVNAPWNLLDLVTMQQQLESIVGRKIDLIEKRVVEQSENWIRRKEILSTATVIYSHDSASLLDMAKAARLSLEFVQGMDQVTFETDRKTQSAVLYQIAILGEAVKRLSPAFRDQYPNIPWSAMAGMRDITPATVVNAELNSQSPDCLIRQCFRLHSI